MIDYGGETKNEKKDSISGFGNEPCFSHDSSEQHDV